MKSTETHNYYSEFNPGTEHPVAHETSESESESGGRKKKGVFKTLKYTLGAAGVTAAAILASGAVLACSLRSVSSVSATVEVKLSASKEKAAEDESYTYYLSEKDNDTALQSGAVSYGNSLIVFDDLTPSTEYKIVFVRQTAESSEPAAEFSFKTTAAGSDTAKTGGDIPPDTPPGEEDKPPDENKPDEEDKPEEEPPAPEELTEPEITVSLSVSDGVISGSARVTPNDAVITGGRLVYEGAYFSSPSAEQLTDGYRFATQKSDSGGVRTFTLYVDYELGGEQKSISVTRTATLTAAPAPEPTVTPPSIISLTYTDDGANAEVALNGLVVNTVTSNNAGGVSEGIIDFTFSSDGETAAVDIFTDSDATYARAGFSPTLGVGTHELTVTVTYWQNGAAHPLTRTITVTTPAFELVSAWANPNGANTDIHFTYRNNAALTLTSGNITFTNGAALFDTVSADEFAAGAAVFEGQNFTTDWSGTLSLTLSDGNTYTAPVTIETAP